MRLRTECRSVDQVLWDRGNNYDDSWQWWFLWHRKRAVALSNTQLQQLVRRYQGWNSPVQGVDQVCWLFGMASCNVHLEGIGSYWTLHKWLPCWSWSWNDSPHKHYNSFLRLSYRGQWMGRSIATWRLCIGSRAGVAWVTDTRGSLATLCTRRTDMKTIAGMHFVQKSADPMVQTLNKFLHDWPRISPWIKSISNKLDNIFHVHPSRLSRHCDVISNRLWRHQQGVNPTGSMCEAIVKYIFLCHVRNKMIYVLSWQTFYAPSLVLFWCLFPSLLRNSGNKT